MLEIGLRFLVVNSLVTCRKFAFFVVHSKFLLCILVTSGDFPSKARESYKKSSLKATSPKERLFDANLRYTLAQQSTADTTLALEDFLYLNLQINIY